MSKLYNYYTELPSWAKGVVVVAGVGGAVIIGNKIYKKIFPSQSEKQAKQFVNTIKTDINRWRFEGLTPSYPEAQYLTLANSVYEGMKYCVGDSYSNVEDVLKKMQNNLDVALLIDAFGIRQNYCFGLAVGQPLDMIAFVKKELGNDFMGLTDYRVKRINDNWSKKGITYKI